MLIILEGADLAGKSTIARELEHQLTGFGGHVKLLHRGAPKLAMPDEYLVDLMGHDMRDHIICDRWHVGELIYGPKLRGFSQLDVMGWLEVEKRLTSLRMTMVHVDPGWQTLRERYTKKGDEVVYSLELLYEIHRSYRRYFDLCPPSFVATGHISDATEIIDCARSKA
jgi:hypothetical protein